MPDRVRTVSVVRSDDLPCLRLHCPGACGVRGFVLFTLFFWVLLWRYNVGMSTPPTRGPGRLHHLMQALRDAGAKSGHELTWFFGELLDMARDPEDGRSRAALAILDKCIPAYKPAGEVVVLELDPDPSVAHGQIMAAVAAGKMSADTGAMLVSMLEAGQRIATAGQLTDEIKSMREELEIVEGELATRNIGAEGAPQILPAAAISDASPADIPPTETR